MFRKRNNLQSSVEIKGRKYSAHTGEPLSSPKDFDIIRKPASSSNSAPVAAAQNKDHNESPSQPSAATGIDGIMGPAGQHHNRKQQSKIKSQHVHARQNSKSDNNSTKVKKPVPTVKHPEHSLTDVQRLALGIGESANRRIRASQYQKSHHIRKFSPYSLQAEQQPERPQEAQQARAEVAKQDAAVPQRLSVSQLAMMAAEAYEQSKGLPAKKKSRLAGLFKVRLPRKLNFAAALASILIIAGYITYLNIPNMALRIAASRAGVDATLPAYKPEDFSFNGPVTYSKGQVVVNFSSKSGDGMFTITQAKSNWDSKSLYDNYISQVTDDSTEFRERGITVYIWGRGNASWVNKGIWYTLETDDSYLSPDQLLRIAASL